MKRLLVHADDFNLTPGVNQGIQDAYRDGIVRSTSVMCNLPGLEESAASLRDTPGLDAGLHVNLTWGRPVLPAEQVPSLVDETGHFFRKPSLVAPRMDPAEAEAEIRAQVASALDAGIRLSHLDSHHHLHEHPAITRVLIAVATERKLGMRSYDASRAAIQAAGVPTPDHIIVEFYGEGIVSEERLLEVLAGLPDGVSELCCHPAVVDDRLRAISSYAAPRTDELRILCSPRVRQALDGMGIALTSFADLA